MTQVEKKGMGLAAGSRGRRLGRAVMCAAAVVFTGSIVYAQPSVERLPEGAVMTTHQNPHGLGGILFAEGAVDFSEEPFFAPLGLNGRSCATCHQMSDGMSLAADTAKRIWRETDGKHPLFAAVDGSNCPSLPQGQESSHSLLLEKGLFRISLPWPPKKSDGSPLDPQFTIEVVRDPTGCNLDPVFGLTSDDPRISVYRRPRMAANLKYVLDAGNNPGRFLAKSGQAVARDPITGAATSMNMMADARQVTLPGQAAEAMVGHMEGLLAENSTQGHAETSVRPTPEQMRQIVEFESQIYAAQVYHNVGGDLTEPGGPGALGPLNLLTSKTGILGNNFDSPAFKTFEMWANPSSDDPKSNFRASVARGSDIFFLRPFWIKDAMHINTLGLGNPMKRTCATCHSTQMTGMNLVAGWADVGTTNLPWAVESPDLPLFKLTCNADQHRNFHPFLGRVVYTQDPGRALISGRCDDIGSIVQGQFRSLAARAPYFSNGSARNLEELVNFYDRRFNMALSSKEREDLVNFLSVL